MTRQTFNTRLRLIKRIEERVDGEAVATFEPLCDVWANVEPTRGSKIIGDGTIVEQNPYTITARYSKLATRLQANDMLRLPDGTQLRVTGPTRHDPSLREIYIEAEFLGHDQ